MPKVRHQLVISLPALLGVALVLVYIFGVLNAAGSFAKADIPSSAIRFLSVEQLLVRGISILAQPGVIGVVLAIGIGTAAIRQFSNSPLGPISPARKARIIRVGTKLGLIYLFGIAITLMFRPWEVGVSLAPFLGMALFMIVMFRRGRPPHAISHELALLYVASSLASLLIGSFFLPLPQPSVDVACAPARSASSSCHEGVLITHTDGEWYVWQKTAEKVSVLPDAVLTEAHLIYPNPTTGPTPASYLKGLIF